MKTIETQQLAEANDLLRASNKQRYWAAFYMMLPLVLSLVAAMWIMVLVLIVISLFG